jgi:hypothetical protein
MCKRMCTHMHMHMHMCMCMCVLMCMCMCVLYLYVCVCVCARAYRAMAGGKARLQPLEVPEAHREAGYPIVAEAELCQLDQPAHLE